MPCGYFFPLNNYHKSTTHSVYYFNGQGSQRFLEDYRGSRAKKFGKPWPKLWF